MPGQLLWQPAPALETPCSLRDVTSNVAKDMSSKDKVSFLTGPWQRLIHPRQKRIHCLFSVLHHHFDSLLTVSENACFHISPISIYSGMTLTVFNDDTLNSGAKRTPAYSSNKQ